MGHMLAAYDCSGDARLAPSEIDEAEMVRKLAEELSVKLPSLSRDCPDTLVAVTELGDLLSLGKFAKNFRGVQRLGRRGRKNLIAGLRAGAGGKKHSIEQMKAGVQQSWKLANKAVKGTAEAHLTYNFGIAPTINDSVGLLTALYDWKRRIASLRKGVNKVHTLKCGQRAGGEARSLHIPVREDGRCIWNGSVVCPRGTSYGWDVSYHKNVIYRTCVQYTYTWPEALWGWEEKVGSFLASIGFKGGWSSAWEKIPFSFVIDWFINTDKLFKKIGLDRAGGYDVTVRILEQIVSRKEFATRTWSYLDCCARGSASSTTSLYERSLMGLDAVTPWGKVPRVNQLILGLALAAGMGHVK
jgi:hypothetical protein